LITNKAVFDNLALDFTQLLSEGKVEEAADKYWATNVTILKPASEVDKTCDKIQGFFTARNTLSRWLSCNKMEDITIDGPFVTGNQFALFIDMQIVNLADGKRKEFGEIATFIMMGNKIVEERFFY
jgi:hypothetical protein